ncbi:SCO2522 family protein [Nocardia sp. NPDC058640]|uniref:SCO2522 family protein n=1 Tax=Nocardia sp. NPDC058640 TaxID=3346571 RepID=UPI0036564734
MNSPTYREASEESVITPLPMAHLSIEVCHFRHEEILYDTDLVRAQFRRAVPLVAAFIESARIEFGPDTQVSTCYLTDDYFQPRFEPADVLDGLLGAAADAGLTIDYLARESACHQAPVFAGGVAVGENVPVAEMVAARLIAQPEDEEVANGRRPPTAESGWLCNGRREQNASSRPAMHPQPYRPPQEYGRGEHSIFLDVELWHDQDQDQDQERRWSCPFLAAVWQLLRLGMLRYHGAPVVDPQLWTADRAWPDRWTDLPPVMRLNPDAAPFTAYRTLSMLPKRYLLIESAVRVILDHLAPDDDVAAQVAALGSAEGVLVPAKVVERVGHLLLDGT